MTKRIYLLALLALVPCLEGAEGKDQWMVRGEGQLSCGAWTKAQAHRPAIGADNKYLATDIGLSSQIAWVSGFLSAFDYYGNGSGNVSSSTDGNGILAWIDNYCAAHPLDNIEKATVALVSELAKRAGQ